MQKSICHSFRNQVGYDADIVVYDKNPIDISSKVELTIINGEIVYKNGDL